MPPRVPRQGGLAADAEAESQGPFLWSAVALFTTQYRLHLSCATMFSAWREEDPDVRRLQGGFSPWRTAFR